MRPVRATAISRSAAGTNGSTSSRRNARSSATKKDARKSIGSRTRKSATRRSTAAFTPSPRCVWILRTGSAKATRSKSARRLRAQKARGGGSRSRSRSRSGRIRSGAPRRAQNSRGAPVVSGCRQGAAASSRAAKADLRPRAPHRAAPPKVKTNLSIAKKNDKSPLEYSVAAGAFFGDGKTCPQA